MNDWRERLKQGVLLLEQSADNRDVEPDDIRAALARIDELEKELQQHSAGRRTATVNDWRERLDEYAERGVRRYNRAPLQDDVRAVLARLDELEDTRQCPKCHGIVAYQCERCGWAP